MSAKNVFAVAAVLTVVAVAVAASLNKGGAKTGGENGPLELLNVSYDPTRELWKEVNQIFIPKYQQESGRSLDILQSHGGSSSQARAVIDGQEADVVTLALWSDTDALRKQGLIKEGWENQFPELSLPYISTIAFVVRKGNPKGIKDWPDLVKEGVVVVTPNPKTSGNGKLSFLAAWGSVLQRGGSEEEARAFTGELYRHAPVLDTGARGSTITFTQKAVGDVHLTWENEAYLEVQDSNGELEIVYPSASIRAEPHVAIVDQNVDRKGTRAAAEAYLNFLYTTEGQELIAKHYYRPTNAEILAKHSDRFPQLELFPITAVAASWDDAQSKYFAEGAIFDSLQQADKAAE